MLIEWGIINYKLIIPLIYPFLYQIRRFIHKNDTKPFYEFFTNYCGYLFSGIIYLIIIIRMKNLEKKANENEDSDSLKTLELESFDSSSYKQKRFTKIPTIKIPYSNTVKNQIILERNRIRSRKMKKKYLFILLLSTIYLIPMFLDSYCSSNKNVSFKTSSSLSLFFCIISYVILSRIILGNKIYFHQYVSLAIIIVCNVVSIILILIGEDNSNLIINMVLMLVILSLYALYNVLEKKFFNKFMDSPYHLMFIVGLISLIIILIYETITVLVFGKDNDFNGIFYQIQLNIKNIKLYPLLFIGDVISAFLWVAGIHLTVYFFTPCHFIISESLSQILSTFRDNTLEGRNIGIQVIIYILFGIILFSAFIYNEVIIKKVFSLEKNTKKYIENRSIIEKNLIYAEDRVSDLSEKNNSSEL